METTPAEIAQLVHRQAIETRLIDYCRHLDEMDLDALVQNFTEDCQITYGPDPRLEARGRKALKASLARMWRWRRTAHHLCNVRLWFDGPDNASAESAVWAWHEAQGGSRAEVYGVYRDSLIHSEDGWLIRQRSMSMRGASESFRVPIPQAHRHPPPPGWTAPDGLDD
ncbi:MAG: nuclear transport factor 2 family protein [Pseudomonadota bacterium]